MYKVEFEDIENKLSKIRLARRQLMLPVLMGFSGLFIFLYTILEDKDLYLIIFLSFTFLQAFALYYYILPILGKLDLIEQDIKNIKQATGVEDQKHF